MNSTIAGLTLAASVFVGVPYASIALSEMSFQVTRDERIGPIELVVDKTAPRIGGAAVLGDISVSTIEGSAVVRNHGDGSAAALIDGRSRSLSPSIRVGMGAPTTARSALEPPTEPQDRPVAVEATSRPMAPIPPRVNVEAVIRQAAQVHGVSADQLLRVARCESGLRPDAVNAVSGASGVMQFLPRTWAANSVRAGYAGESVFNVEANVMTAAWMFGHGQSWQWSCT